MGEVQLAWQHSLGVLRGVEVNTCDVQGLNMTMMSSYSINCMAQKKTPEFSQAKTLFNSQQLGN